MATLNNTLPVKDVGIFVTTSKIAYDGVIAGDIEFSDTITLIKCYDIGGWIVWRNTEGENQIDRIAVGETIPVLATAILATTPVNGHTTDAQGIIVKSTGFFVSGK